MSTKKFIFFPLASFYMGSYFLNFLLLHQVMQKP